MNLPTPLSGVPGYVFPSLPPAATSLQLALQFQLEQSQWWPAERLRAEQLRQLGLVVRHAFATSPFYREHYASLGGPPPAELTEADWAKLPIVTNIASTSAAAV